MKKHFTMTLILISNISTFIVVSCLAFTSSELDKDWDARPQNLNRTDEKKIWEFKIGKINSGGAQIAVAQTTEANWLRD